MLFTWLKYVRIMCHDFAIEKCNCRKIHHHDSLCNLKFDENISFQKTAFLLFFRIGHSCASYYIVSVFSGHFTVQCQHPLCHAIPRKPPIQLFHHHPWQSISIASKLRRAPRTAKRKPNVLFTVLAELILNGSSIVIAMWYSVRIRSIHNLPSGVISPNSAW